jgi:hypothetical protein
VVVRCRLLIYPFKFKCDRLRSKNSKKFKFHTTFTYKYHLRSKQLKKLKTRHLFYVSYFKFVYNYFLKFIIHEINSKIIKSKIMVLTMRDNDNIANSNMAVEWSRGREN